MTYKEALLLLEERQETRIDLGLKRLGGHLRRMGDPQDAFPAVIVAGTNGKGSVCALLAAALRAAGYRTGLYTSPHLVDPTERIQVDGVPVSRELFGELLGAVARAETEPLTFFELFTAAAFEHFRTQAVDIAILEVGLGGRLDAVNCAGKRVLTVVTAIDFDHMDYLGDTLAKIAREKAGIFRSGVPALIGEPKPEPRSALEDASREAGAPLSRALEPAPVTEIFWERGIQIIDGFEVSLLGKAQAANVAVVRAALKLLTESGFTVGSESERAGFRQVRWPGRFQVISGPHLPFGHPLPAPPGEVILDGAHNPQAMRVFCETFDASPWAKKDVTFVVGFLKDKDYREMIRILAPRLKKVIATAPPSPRALPAEELATILRQAAPKATISLAPLPTSPRKRGEGIVVCGSFYLVGAYLKELQKTAA